MEKYSQYRDRGSGIAPFFPVPPQPAGLYLPLHIFLFVCRLPLLVAVGVTYFLVFSLLPVGSLIKKAALWLILGIPGIWWIDLQIDAVKRGSVAKHQNRLPQPGSIIASSFTSPIDCLYLAAIFDPVFTASYPSTRLVQRVSLFHAMIRALVPPQISPPPKAPLVSLSTLIRENPDSVIVVLPECTTSNGRGILQLSPSLLSTPTKAKIFPVNLRYSPADITTPVPGAYLIFLWDLCSKPTHCIRVRIAEAIYNTAVAAEVKENAKSRGSYIQDDINFRESPSSETLVGESDAEVMTVHERKVLDRVAEDLARLGRVKRVGLGVKEKIDFVKAWSKTRRIY